MIASLILTAAVLLSLYILVGYPLLLRSWRSFGPSIAKDLEFRTTVSVLLAVYNGEAFIARKLDNLLALDYPAELLDIIVVSDGSTDATDGIVESYAARNVRLVRTPHAGKPAALNVAMQHARGELLLFADVRQMYRLAGAAAPGCEFRRQVRWRRHRRVALCPLRPRRRGRRH